MNIEERIQVAKKSNDFAKEVMDTRYFNQDKGLRDVLIKWGVTTRAARIVYSQIFTYEPRRRLAKEWCENIVDKLEPYNDHNPHYLVHPTKRVTIIDIYVGRNSTPRLTTAYIRDEE